MHAVDWSLLSSVIGAIAGLINACLVLWLILLTRRYVQINEGLLNSALGALTAAQEQSRLSRDTFELMRAQHAADVMQKLAPILAGIDDVIRLLNKWTAYSADFRSYANAIAQSEDHFATTLVEDIAAAASSFSFKAHRRLVEASDACRRLDSEIATTRGFARNNSLSFVKADVEVAKEVRIGIGGRIDEARFSFEQARKELIPFLPVGYTAPLD